LKKFKTNFHYSSIDTILAVKQFTVRQAGDISKDVIKEMKKENPNGSPSGLLSYTFQLNL
jgi:hypothetical protein